MLNIVNACGCRPSIPLPVIDGWTASEITQAEAADFLSMTMEHIDSTCSTSAAEFGFWKLNGNLIRYRNGQNEIGIVFLDKRHAALQRVLIAMIGGNCPAEIPGFVAALITAAGIPIGWMASAPSAQHAIRSQIAAGITPPPQQTQYGPFTMWLWEPA